MPEPSTMDPPGVVLDTNVVLDWMVFEEPAALVLGRVVQDGGLRWIAMPSMRDELEQVLRSERLHRWRFDPAAILARYDRWSRSVDPLVGAAETSGPRCRDPDDQVFVDLAWARRCAWLLSRDRAVLALAGRLRRRGVVATTPERWQAAWLASATADRS